MSWDADATDADLHVGEPSGEVAFYGHNRTATGGMVSKDFTQGYGPEEYLVRQAQPGTFDIFAHYYGSSQQKLIGPATITATVFTNFGRPSEKKEVLTLRLDKPHDKISIGKIQFEKGEKASVAESDGTAGITRETFQTLKPGQAQENIKRLLGDPEKKANLTWIYTVQQREYRVRFSKAGLVVSVVEALPGGAELLLVQ